MSSKIYPFLEKSSVSLNLRGHPIEHRELNSPCDDLEGQDEGRERQVQEGKDIGIYVADSLVEQQKITHCKVIMK